MESVVKAIINPEIKTGIGKNNQPWSQAQVELENGQTVRIFNPIRPGEAVESVQNGEYTNWVVKKLSRLPEPSQGSTEVLEALRKVYGLLSGMDKKLDKLLYGDEQPDPSAKEPTSSWERQRAKLRNDQPISSEELDNMINGAQNAPTDLYDDNGTKIPF